MGTATSFLEHYERGREILYSYETCGAVDVFNPVPQERRGLVRLCSVFAESSVSGRPCGNTASHLQVEAMVALINSGHENSGFRVDAGRPAFPSFYKFTYEWRTYPNGAWDAVGANLSAQLFPTCDVIVGQGHGCSDTEIRAQARVAHRYQRLYFTLRGPQAVLAHQTDPSRRLSPYFFSTHIRSDYYSHVAVYGDRTHGSATSPVSLLLSLGLLLTCHRFDPESPQVGLRMLSKAAAEANNNNNNNDMAASTSLATDQSISIDQSINMAASTSLATGATISVLTVPHNAFFEGVGVEAARFAAASTSGLQLLTSELASDLCQLGSAPTTDAACTPLGAYLDRLLEARPDIAAISCDGATFEYVLEYLSARRVRVVDGLLRSPDLAATMTAPSSSSVTADLTSDTPQDPMPPTHVLKGLWFTGVPWTKNGVPSCAGLATHCTFGVGATQISDVESDSYEDSLIASSSMYGSQATYAWLKNHHPPLKAAYYGNESYVFKAEADAAVIPSIVAQAMQTVFQTHRLETPARPLLASNSTAYERLRAFLASGAVVAQTYYGRVRFDAFGNNAGREATTFQVVTSGEARIIEPSYLGTAVNLVYPAPSYQAARRGRTSWQLDYGEPCQTTADPMPPCAADGGRYESAAAASAAAEDATSRCLLCLPLLYAPVPPVEFDIDLVIGVTVGVGTSLVIVIVWMLHKLRARARAIVQEEIRHVKEALLMQSGLRHTASLVPASVFCSLGRLIAHEELRDRGVLTYCDDMNSLLQLTQDGGRIIFISHQVRRPWPLAPGPSTSRCSTPDPLPLGPWPLAP